MSSESESETDAIVLSSDDEETSQTEADSTGSEVDKINKDLGKVAINNDGKAIKYKEVTKALYDVHVVKIAEITDRIKQYENLLKLSSQLPDKGHKLKEAVVKLNADLIEMQTTLATFKIKETIDISIDFQNLSINESGNERETSTRSFYDDGEHQSISNLFKEIKRSEKSMPTTKDFADQPRLINGKLMPHQRQALAWMIWRENQFPKGGILGDDMGLGKTLSVISLIARHIEMRDSSTPEMVNAEQKEAGAGECKMASISKSFSS